MTTEMNSTEQRRHDAKRPYRGGTSDAVYGLGVLGAWFYYLTHAATIWMGLLGIVKGIFWPAMLVYEMLKYLQM